MPAFTYKALDAEGQVVSGELEAQNRLQVYRELEARSLAPVSVSGSVEAAPAEKEEEEEKVTLRRAQIILFTEELSDLVEAGLQLDQALRVMQDRRDHPALARVSAGLREELREGTALSVALKKVSPSFDDLYCNMIAAGELSGSLPKILRSLVGNLQMAQELQSRVVSALIYPAFMAAAGAALIGIFMTVLVPQLIGLFRKTGQALPLMTRGLIVVSDFCVSYWWVGALVAIGAAAAFKTWTSKPEGRLAWDRLQLRIPLVGEVLETRFLTQFAQTLGNLLANGVPLVSGLRLMARATPNVFLRGVLGKVVTLVGEGAAFSTALKQCGVFPPVFIDIVSVGEQTGKTAAALEKAGVRYDKDLNKRISRFTALIQPAIVVVMAVIITVVALSIITGIMKSASGLR